VTKFFCFFLFTKRRLLPTPQPVDFPYYVSEPTQIIPIGIISIISGRRGEARV